MSCVIYSCYYHNSIIYELVVYFVSHQYKKMRNDKTLFVNLSCNIKVGTCAIYPLYNSIDKHEKPSLIIPSLSCLFIFETSFVSRVSK